MSDRSVEASSDNAPTPDATGFSVDIAMFNGTLEGVSLPMGLCLDRVQVTGTGLTGRSTSGSGDKSSHLGGTLSSPALLEVMVSQSGLESFLSSKSPGGLKDFAVTLEGGKVNVTATLHVLIDMRASAVCRLEIVDGQKLIVVLETAGVLGVTTKNLIQSQIDNVNPVFHTDMLPLPCTLTEVSIENGWVRVRGEILPFG